MDYHYGFAEIPQLELQDDDKLSWLRLIRTPYIGPITFYQLIAKFGTAQAALEALPDFSRQSGRKTPLIPYPADKAEQEFESVHSYGAQMLFASEDAYPEGLKAIEDCPPVLILKGDINLLKQEMIGIVGSRNASLNAQKFAKTLATDLSDQGYVVVSGLARGIDTAAHEGALKHGTIGVVAGGIDVVYPKENERLHHAMFEKGLVISENALGTKPRATDFPRRNRIVSGLSRGVMVVEASPKSGSLITARLAGEQGREVFAAPGFPLDPRAQGTNRLIKEGAHLVESAQDIIQNLPRYNNFERRVEHKPIQLDLVTKKSDAPAPQDEKAETLADLIGSTPVAVDELIRETERPASDIFAELLELELSGHLQRHSGNRVSKV